MSQISPVTETLIENLLQACVDYERCERFDAKHRRLDLEEAKQAIRNAISAGHAQTGQEPLRDILEFWMDRTRLQTFEDRERFRKAAREALSVSSTDQNMVASDPSPENIEPRPEPLL